MPQIINTNMYSLNAQNNLDQTNAGLTEALQRLSSGKRINSAKDDAAGIAIASRFTAQIRGYSQGIRNAADAISMSQVAEGAIDEIVGNVQRIRELSIQSVNSTNSSTDRAALQTEVAQLQLEISRVIEMEFNGTRVLGTDATSFVYQVGPDADTSNIGLNQIKVTTTNLASVDGYNDLVINGTISTASGAASTIDNADRFLVQLNTQRANLGAAQNRFESVITNAQNAVANLSSSRSRIEDADFAAETSKLTRYQVLQQAGISVLSQANSMPNSVLQLLGG